MRLGARVDWRSVLSGAFLLASATASGAATIAGGSGHTLVVKTTDSTVWAWGQNGDGQLGDNTTTARTTPGQVGGLANIVAVAAGAKHSLALRSDGVLFAWGDNAYGQIGNGVTTDQKVPLQVLTGVAFVAAGDYHTVALKIDGTLRTWGYNAEGQLGDGGTANRSTPYQVTGIGLVGYVAAGANHTLAVLSGGGGLKAWGKNTNGQLGDGTTTRATSPVSVVGVTTATAVAGGASFSVSRQVDGSLASWGSNSYGQLGLGDTTQRTTPQSVTAVSAVAAVAAGGSHALALAGAGTVSAWGSNAYGSVGDGSGTNRSSPVSVPGLSSIVAIGAGLYHSLAVTNTGEVWAWGYNNYSQLGDGTTANQLSPIKIAEAGFNWKVATPTFSPVPGTYSANQSVTMACATAGATIRYTTNGSEPTSASPQYTAAVSLTVSTTLKARAFKAGLADSSTATGAYTLKVATPTFSPAAGTYTTAQTVTMAIATAGATIRYTTDGSDPTAGSTTYSAPVSVPTTTTLKAAGFKSGWTTSDIRTGTYTMNFGTLAAPTFSPAPAGYLDSVAVTISAAAGATVRYTTDGVTPGLGSAVYVSPISLTQTTTLKAKAWKADYTDSAVTYGTYTLKVAAPILSRAAGTYPAGTTVTVTAATAGATLNYTLDGSDPTDTDPAVASGASLVLGNYTLKVRSFRAGCDASDIATATYAVTGQLTPGSVAAGQNFSLALLPDGTVFSWGNDSNGRLGDGGTTDRWIPGGVDGLTGIVGIAAGFTHSLAVDAQGRVWSWGLNTSGQVGDGTTTERHSPVLVAGLANVVAVAAGNGFSAALKADGSLWLWGENGLGQLGLGDTTDRSSAVQVLNGVAGLALGTSHVVAVKTDGGVWSWGLNGSSQLGDGGTTNRSTPAQVAGLASVIRVAAGQGHSLAQLATGAIYAWGDNASGQLGDGTNTDRATPTLLSALQGTVAVDGGAAHSLAAVPGGAVLGWGHNGNGQVGDGTTSMRNLPVAVPGPTGVTNVAAGEYHSLAISADGSIWAWGSNVNGRLGDGTTVSRATPVKVRDGANWRVGTPTFAPAGGSYTAVQSVTVADKTPGAVIRYTMDGSHPGPSSAQVASGGTVAVDHSLTLKAKAWNAGMADSDVATAIYSLTVPTPTMTPSGGTFNTPQTVAIACAVSGVTIRYTTNGLDPTPADPVIVSGGTISVDASRTVKAKAWRGGWADSGVASASFEMVVATPALAPSGGSYSAAQVVAATTITPVAVLRYTLDGRQPTPADPPLPVSGQVLVDKSVTVKVVGFRAGWTPSDTGSESYFLQTGTAASPAFSPPPGTYSTPQWVALYSATPNAVMRYTLDGTTPGYDSPVYFEPLFLDLSTTITARAFAADLAPSPASSGLFAVSSAGAVVTPSLAPAPGRTATAAAVSASTPTAGAVVRYTTSGGEPSPSSQVLPVGASVMVDQSLVLRVKGWKDGLQPSQTRGGQFVVSGALASGQGHMLALAADGSVWSWGQNANGQLGNGTTSASGTPAPISGLPPIVAVAAGMMHSLALDSTGHVWGWGLNSRGELGDGTTTTRLLPTVIPGLAGVRAIAAGYEHSYAIKTDGSAFAWGDNRAGALGDGTTTQRLTPVPILGLGQLVAIAAGYQHALAVTADGRAWSWGANANGELGDGSTQGRVVPAAIAGLTGVAAVGAGSGFSVALKTDGRTAGSIWSWGRAAFGQLGYPSAASSRPGFLREGVVDLAIGNGHGLMLTQVGEALAWGEGGTGQLGDSVRLDRFRPVAVAGLHDALSLSAGTYHSAVVHADGRVSTWGSVVTGTDSDTPALVAGLRLVSNDFLAQDGDDDGLTNLHEWRHGCDPYRADSNGDGLPDGAAVALGASCSAADTDGDGVLNVHEIAAGTSPFSSDSDGDGTGDVADCAPLDSTRSTCPPTPGDTTPPSITILEPANATPLP